MKKITNIIITIIAIILVTIATLWLFSSKIEGAWSDRPELVDTTTNFAKQIINYRKDFIEDSIDNIFKRNINVNGTTKGLKVGNVEEKNKYDVDIGYNSSVCIFHSAANSTDEDDYAVKLTNIIDIDTSGKVKVYLYSGMNRKKNTVTYTSKEKDYSSNANAKKDLAMFTYLLYQSNELGKTSVKDNEFNDYKDIITYTWKKNVGTKAVREYIKDCGKLDTYYYDKDPLSYADYGETHKTIVSNAKTKATELSGNHTLTKKTTSPSVQYSGGKAYVGPLKITHGNDISTSIEVYNGKKWIAATGWATKSNGKFGKTETGRITSNQVFYAVTDASNVSNLSDVKIKVKSSYEKYNARIVLACNKWASGQNLMFYGTKKTTGSDEVSWTVQQTKSVTIQKQYVNGNTIKVEGIEFKIYDSKNKLKGTLTTDKEGKTNSINLSVNNQYTVKETYNPMYGYKNASINSATMTSNAGTISASGGEATFTLTGNSNAIIYITNTKDLAKLTVNKKNQSGNAQSGVEFVLYKAQTTSTGYIRLKDSKDYVSTIKSGIKITDYKVEYTTDIGLATKFITNSDGEIQIEGLEKYSSKGTLYNYYLREVKNTHYGYKGLSIHSTKYGGGSDIEVESDGDIPFTLNGSDITVEITNKTERATLKVEKKNQSGNAQAGVKFVLYKAIDNSKGYIQLKNKTTSQKVDKITSSIDVTDYTMEYVTDIGSATQFVTNSNGNIEIGKLERYSSKGTLYNYYLREIENPNYGYKGLSISSAKYSGGSDITVDTDGDIPFTLSTTTEKTTLEITNKQNLGAFSITKKDDFNTNILLPNVGFAIEIKADDMSGYNYLALYNQKGEVVRSVKGNVTTSSQNAANDSSYRVGYYQANKSYKQLTENEKRNITEFKTGDNGVLTVNNMEVYTISGSGKYKYKLIEISNANYGYDLEATGLENIELELANDKTTTETVLNTSILTKISGYVWLENTAAKTNEYDNAYTNNNIDKKLKDLYTIKDGQLKRNENAEIPVEIQLYDKKERKVLKTLPDEFDAATGKYTFVDVDLENLPNYGVRFIYDGFYYTTVVPQIDKDNGSKVKETPEKREELNNKFGIVKEGNEIISVPDDKNKVTTGTVKYDKEKDKNPHTSQVADRKSENTVQVADLSFNTTISATTGQLGYNIKEVYDSIKSKATVPIETVENVNMGIVLREQPKLALGSDIYSVYVNVNGKAYTYNYNGRQKHYNNLNETPIGAKFEQENSNNRYTRTVYSSDVQALESEAAEMEVKITYKIQLTNQAATLTSKIYQIKNYYDERYTIEAIGATFDEVNPMRNSTANNGTDKFEVTETTENIQAELGEGVELVDAKYKSAKISINGENGLELEAQKSKDIYIRFDVQKEAIKKLLDNSSTYHNATEILSYSTYYGAKTAQLISSSDETKAGKIYGGIDKTSQPGNINLKLIKQGQGIPVLDASEFEDDTASAPSLLLVAEESRKISGTVWEDATQYTDKTGRLGNGRFENGEKLISGVKVTLHKLKADGTAGDVATYSDGETLAETVTDKNGNYTLGYYDEQSKKYLGILPSKYIIKYTYGTIANEETEEKIKTYIIISNEESKYVNANNYKSTIISSKVVEEAFNKGGDLRWYLRSDENKIRYSDARDDINLRNEYKKDESKYTIKNSNYNELYNTFMIAYTPCMEVPVEYTKEDESSALIEKNSLLEMARLEKELKQLDFGIAERACTDIKIDKNITGLEIVSQTGASIVSKGNPSDLNSIMQHVKKLDDLVSVEIESDMLQGAQLNLEYSITVTNNSEIDYLDEEYYYYGRNPRTPTTAKVKKVIDYLDSTLIFDKEKDKDGIWKQVTTDELAGYVEYNIMDKLKKEGEQTAFITDAFDGLNREEKTRTFKLYATKSLATTNNLVESNGAEIIEIYGVRIITSSIPGNYNPAFDDYEIDEDKVDLIITPPTGTTTNYSIYIIAAIATFAILILGIVIIKKKIIK